MDNNLIDIAGGDPLTEQPDAYRAACKDAIAPVIRQLLQKGVPAGSIITALAELTVMTVERQRQH